MVLDGYEVKSLRQGKASLTDALVRIYNMEAYLENVHIPQYLQQSTHVKDYNPKRKRKLLFHKNEIKRLFGRVREKGLALIPLEIYFSKRNRAKVSVGLGKGKRMIDKRDVIKRKDLDREMQRELK